MGTYHSGFPQKIAVSLGERDMTIIVSRQEQTRLIAEGTRDGFAEFLSSDQPIGFYPSLDLPAHVLIAAGHFRASSARYPELLGLASIYRCAAPGLRAYIQDAFPRAAIRAEVYAGPTLKPADLGVGIITSEDLWGLFEKYSFDDHAEEALGVVGRPSERVGDRPSEQMIVAAIFTALDQCSGLLCCGTNPAEVISQLMAELAGAAIRRGHLDPLSALELCGKIWSAKDEQLIRDQDAKLYGFSAGSLVRYWRLRGAKTPSARPLG